MKKVILSIAVLAAISTTSCKKAYECSCTDSETTEYVSHDSDWDSYAESLNDNNAQYTTQSTKYVNTTDKTSKAEANANCTSATTTNTEVYIYGSGGNDSAVDRVTTTKTECSLAKK